jgi:hypothetical protein
MAKIRTPKKIKGTSKFFSPGSPLSLEQKLYMLAGGLSPLGIGRRVDATKLGRAGRFGLGSLRFLGLTNPWLMAPAALTGLAKYSVGKAFDPYRDETGRIGAAGHERLLQERLAREELMTARNIARGQENVTGMFSEGGIARLL